MPPRALALFLSSSLVACASGPTSAAVAPPSRHVDPTLGGAPGGAASTVASGLTITPGAGDVVLRGTAGGPVAFADIGATCTGYGTSSASHVVFVAGAGALLTFLGSSDVDTVMVVRLPNGDILCNDDGAGYPNPLITTTAVPGRHEVWVGTYSPGNSGTYTVTVSAAR